MVLSLAVLAARTATARRGDGGEPEPGDLVVEVTRLASRVDPDAIGYLVGHDDAPYSEGDPTDGSVPMREVWDIRPLSGRHRKGRGWQRWEDAEFRAVPEWLLHHFKVLGVIE